MQPLLFMLLVTAFAGLRSHRTSTPMPRSFLLIVAILFAVVMLSRRFL